MFINIILASPTGEFVYRAMFIWGKKRKKGKEREILKEKRKEDRTYRVEGTKEFGEKKWGGHKKKFFLKKKFKK